MFRSLQRLPLRRCVHTSTTRPANAFLNGRVGLAVGASAVLTSYAAWRALRSENQIALDSATHPPREKSAPLSPQASVSADPLSATNSTVLTPEPSLHHEDTPSDETPQSDSPQPKPAEAAEGAAGEQDDAEGAGGAFNPVTGEINWDCPCLGGMAHGICGAQFREAFSCFVFSEKEPKGIDCVEKFKAMQDCFREHPDVYGDEIMDDDDDEDEEAMSAPGASAPAPAAQVSGQDESPATPPPAVQRKHTSESTPSPA
ncbi:hypothetical protein EIP86_009106 [Pleurotus ostreatoroseus]|nr:hypothetical protein EIP86_009106 [Pleurotus ostreatoroseus]